MTVFLYLMIVTAFLILLGVQEYRKHIKQLSKVPIRVHVNGTRGKSSVTRLIAAGLRAGGIRTFAKTTGTTAKVISDNGDEFSVYRPSGANIIEQLRVIDFAARNGAEALVIECMALQPMYQSLCELKIIKSTVGVITNARAGQMKLTLQRHFLEQLRSKESFLPQKKIISLFLKWQQKIVNLQLK
jgi:poly-gamma-glutamate synthase PgsB/CapB